MAMAAPGPHDGPHEFHLAERRPAADGRLVAYCECGRFRSHAWHHGRRAYSPVVTGGHPFRLGPATALGSDGRVYRLCADCGKAANAPRHRASAIDRPRVEISERLTAYKTPQDAPRTRAAAVSHPPRPAAALGLGSGMGPGPNGAAGLQPSPAAPPGTTSRAIAHRPIAPHPAETVALAIALDALLALPGDRLDWKVRRQAADLRDALDLPVWGSLAADDAPRAADGVTETVAEVLPSLATRTRPAAPEVHAATLIRGIRSGRNRALVQRAARDGWTVTKTGSGHIALAKGSQRLIVSTTQAEGRGHGWGNLRAEARRVGIDVTGL